MQDRYAGDIGDYVKFALLRALGAGERLAVAWYLHPDEGHNGDGRHLTYLDCPEHWRGLDPDLFDALAATSRRERSVAALVRVGVLPGATFSGEVLASRALPAQERCGWRAGWFERTLGGLEGATLAFADPDNGLVDNAPHRRRQPKFGKQMPLAEALAMAEGRTAVIYHHNTRMAGGHDREVALWRERLGPNTLAVRSRAWSCRTFFIVNPSLAIAERAREFCARWARHKVRLDC